MPKKLEMDALQADLSALDRLLQVRTEEDDPVGWMQYHQRKNEIETQIKELSDSAPTNAEISLFFAGRPVLGSRGISSEFSSKIIGNFQNLVSKKYASSEISQLPARGRIPQRGESGLMICDVIRGSFGFVFSETDTCPELADTTLKSTVAEVADLIYRFSAADTESLDAAYDEIDPRILGEIQQFFSTLGDYGAILRLVEGEREFTLDADAVIRGRKQVEALEIEEGKDIKARGYLYILPLNGRFNLLPEDGGEPLSGVLNKEMKAEIIGADGHPKSEYNGQLITAVLSKKMVRQRSILRHTSYSMTGISTV